MKKIIIVDVAAEKTGALTILKHFHKIALEQSDYNWRFVLSIPKLSETNNVSISNYNWIKKSWFHRLFFDIYYIKKIVKNEKPDLIISLQNIYVKGSKCPQIIYLHQSIPFTKIKFKFFKETILWINKNILSRLIYSSLKKADEIIVQSNWMKAAVIDQLRIQFDKIHVITPIINIDDSSTFIDTDVNRCRLFYPAIFTSYKNHKVLVEAMEKINCNHKYTLYLTGNKEDAIKRGICKDSMSYIKFCGKLSFKEMRKMYLSSILVFPSKLETFGLPLLEARSYNSFVIASNTAFSKEILLNYKNAQFFDEDDSDMLARIILDSKKAEYFYHRKTSNDYFNSKSDLISVIQIINKLCD